MIGVEKPRWSASRCLGTERCEHRLFHVPSESVGPGAEFDDQVERDILGLGNIGFVSGQAITIQKVNEFGPLFDGETLRHYDASLYIADAPLMYLSNFDCPAGGGTDKYDFEADGSEVTVIFHCTPTTTTTTTCPGFQFSCASTTSTTVP